MDVEEFIARTLVQIIDGVQRAKDEVEDVNRGGGATINPNPEDSGIQIVEFDIALEVADKASGSVKVAGLASSQLGATSMRSEISRVKYRVPISLPTKKLTASEREFRESGMLRKL